MTNIEWTDRVWNPVIGCTPVSPGCLNCYAATMANRLQSMPNAVDYAPRPATTDEIAARHGAGVNTLPSIDKTIRIAEVRGGRAVFTGDVRTLDHKLTDPLRWKRPSRVFVNSMSDLFHEAVPFEFIDKVFAVMALCPQHTFQVLTKRPERMTEYMAARKASSEFWETACPRGYTLRWEHEGGSHPLCTFPPPNVWLGTSVENQETADERIPHLRKCPAAVRFLSCEPLLGPIDRVALDGIRWVIVGGESGPGARSCAVAWERSIVTQCREAGVACFVKQLGAWVYDDSKVQWGTTCAENRVKLKHSKGGDPAEWPEDLRVREMPGDGEKA